MTILKYKDYKKSHFNEFELLGSDEVATTKAFAYVLANSPIVTKRFLKEINVSINGFKNLYHESEILIETKRKSGRTDIEIQCSDKLHVIIEAKIKANKLSKQRTQYLKDFNKSADKKVMCFITHERSVSIDKNKEIITKFFTWNQIFSLLSSVKSKKQTSEIILIDKFLKFYERRIKMREQKEILIQDVGQKSEVERFREYYVYRRPETYGAPLYFAPHFPKNSKQPEGVGISYLSKVLGVLTIKSSDILKYTDDLQIFAGHDSQLVKNWIKGVSLKSNSKIHTFYFLDKPIDIKPALQKDGGIKKGRGIGWIAGLIPPNRCVTFKEFSRRMSNK
jgi:hypothetical protein